MAKVKLSMEEWHNVVKSLNKLLHLLYDASKERDAYKKQRDELINDMEKVKDKAKAFDKILDINIDKDELMSEEYIEKVNDVVQEWIYS
ncbi:MAG: hypothetical protein KH542_11095 [Streptococcus sp.]|uniref:hypothetical protein n=1 Tax=Streptococcus sp. TaxID=1306 RepID=UPI0025D1F4F4|nr:hypothetical protein [Streptococcus sp.]MBS6245590.1 hypothetical protein [Streptococcus sp.]